MVSTLPPVRPKNVEIHDYKPITERVNGKWIHNYCCLQAFKAEILVLVTINSATLVLMFSIRILRHYNACLLTPQQQKGINVGVINTDIGCSDHFLVLTELGIVTNISIRENI